jgi:hypothetical protein
VVPSNMAGVGGGCGAGRVQVAKWFPYMVARLWGVQNCTKRPCFADLKKIVPCNVMPNHTLQQFVSPGSALLALYLVHMRGQGISNCART